MCGMQAKLKADLVELVERNKDDITHYNMLTEHYDERERNYEVHLVDSGYLMPLITSRRRLSVLSRLKLRKISQNKKRKRSV